MTEPHPNDLINIAADLVNQTALEYMGQCLNAARMRMGIDSADLAAVLNIDIKDLLLFEAGDRMIPPIILIDLFSSGVRGLTFSSAFADEPGQLHNYLVENKKKLG